MFESYKTFGASRPFHIDPDFLGMFRVLEILRHLDYLEIYLKIFIAVWPSSVFSSLFS